MRTVQPTDSIPINGLFGYVYTDTSKKYSIIAMRTDRDGYRWMAVDPYVNSTCYFNRQTDDVKSIELPDLVREQLDEKVPVFQFDSMADLFKWITKYHK